MTSQAINSIAIRLLKGRIKIKKNNVFCLFKILEEKTKLLIIDNVLVNIV